MNINPIATNNLPHVAKKAFDPRLHTAHSGQLIITARVKPIPPVETLFNEINQQAAPRPWQQGAPVDNNGAFHPRPWQRGPPEANAQEDPNPQPLSEEDFWGLIGQCQWANRDDGRTGSVGHIKKLSPTRYAQFMEHYDKVYDGLKTILDTARIFTIRGIRDNLEIRKIISHVIGLGKESYMTIMTGENTFIEYFIDANQCISLDALL